MLPPPLLAQSGASDLTGLLGWIADVVVAIGAVGVGAMVALEAVVPPIPSELVLPLAGFLAGRGELSLWGALLASTMGSVAGALGAYWLGASLGRERVGRLWARVPLSEAEDLERADAWFAGHQLGARWHVVGRYSDVLNALVIAALVAGLGLATGRRLARRRRRGARHRPG